jgi:hypothetical protein
MLFCCDNLSNCRSQLPCGLKRRSAAARLLRSWVWIPPGAWMFVCCESCVLSCRGLCDELITCPEESYRLWCVVMCDLENLKNEVAMTRVGSQRHRKKNLITELKWYSSDISRNSRQQKLKYIRPIKNKLKYCSCVSFDCNNTTALLSWFSSVIGFKDRNRQKNLWKFIN